MSRWKRLRQIERDAHARMLDARVNGGGLSLAEARRQAAEEIRNDEARRKYADLDEATEAKSIADFYGAIDSPVVHAPPAAPATPYAPERKWPKEVMAFFAKLERMNADYLSGKDAQPRPAAAPAKIERAAEAINIGNVGDHQNESPRVPHAKAKPHKAPTIDSDFIDPCLSVRTRGVGATKWIGGEVGNPGTYGR